MKFTRAALLALSLCMAGCATNAPVTHPGAVSAFDSNAYDALLSVQAGIESARTQFLSVPAAKEPLNRVIAAYNGTMNSYRVYHAAMVAGTAQGGDAAALQSQIDSLKTSLASVVATFGKGATK